MFLWEHTFFNKCVVNVPIGQTFGVITVLFHFHVLLALRDSSWTVQNDKSTYFDSWMVYFKYFDTDTNRQIRISPRT